MTWQRDDPALYEKEKAQVEAHFPELRFVVENDLVYVRGSFAVMFEAQVLDRYSVELQLARNHPAGLPVVRETGGRIPRCDDRHINAADVLPGARGLFGIGIDRHHLLEVRACRAQQRRRRILI